MNKAIRWLTRSQPRHSEVIVDSGSEKRTSVGIQGVDLGWRYFWRTPALGKVMTVERQTFWRVRGSHLFPSFAF